MGAGSAIVVRYEGGCCEEKGVGLEYAEGKVLDNFLSKRPHFSARRDFGVLTTASQLFEDRPASITH